MSSHVLMFKKIVIPQGLQIDPQLLLDSFPEKMRKSVLQAETPPGTFQFLFLVGSGTSQFIIAALYFGKLVELQVQNESRIMAPLLVVRRALFDIHENIQKHISALIEAQDLIDSIQKMKSD